MAIIASRACVARSDLAEGVAGNEIASGDVRGIRTKASPYRRSPSMVINCNESGSEEGIDTSTERVVEVSDGRHVEIIALAKIISQSGVQTTDEWKPMRRVCEPAYR